MAAGESRTLTRQHSFKAVTTRRYHAGLHAIDVSINGGVAASASVTLSLP